VAKHALNSDWGVLLEDLALDGITVKFQDASGEEIRFEKALLVKDLKREEEPEPDDREESGGSSGGGGCNAGWSTLFFSLLSIATLRTKKQG
jgi:hypothetical protein